MGLSYIAPLQPHVWNMKLLSAACGKWRVSARNFSTDGKPLANDGSTRPAKHRFEELYDTKKAAFFEKMRNTNARYEEFIGLKDVQSAQQKVKQAEGVFLAARAKERAVLREMVETREKLKNVRERLSHVDYSNTMYLQLASDQHELVNEEERQKRELEEVEENERDSFLDLSTAMRESYEKERTRVERTKNWSIIGTVIGTMIGMVGSIYMNRVRTKELLKAVKSTGNKQTMEEKIENLTMESDKKYDALAAVLTNVAENLVELGNTLQVQNLQVMAGFVENALTEEGKKSAGSTFNVKNHSANSAHLQAISEELSNYNIALSSLVNAVSALTGTTSMSNFQDFSDNMKALLQDQTVLLKALQTNLTEIADQADKLVLGGISTKLDDINAKISSLVSSQSILSAKEDTTAVYGVPEQDCQPYGHSKWPVGVKDVVLWGSIFCCLYMFVKF